MKYYVEESLSNFKFWSGGADTAASLSDDQLDTIEQMMEEIEPEDGWSDTGINDFFWFDTDTIAEWLGYKDWEYLEMGITNDEIEEAQGWFDSFDLGVDAAIEIAGLDEQEYIVYDDDDEPTGELDSDRAMTDFQCWWNDLSDIERVTVYREHNTP